jgi:hypothetical protein
MRYAHILVSVVSAGILSAPAGATLITVDLVSPGDGLITLDTETGLEWLDLTESVNRSFDDVSGQFGPGEDFEGWRHATGSEVCRLVSTYAVAVGPVCPEFFVRLEGSDEVVTHLLSFLGVTSTPPSQFSVGWYDDGGGSTPAPGFAGLSNATISDPTVQIILILDDFVGFTPENPIDYTEPFPEWGHSLVRSVPEPSTLALLLLGFGFLARRATQSQ